MNSATGKPEHDFNSDVMNTVYIMYVLLSALVVTSRGRKCQCDCDCQPLVIVRDGCGCAEGNIPLEDHEILFHEFVAKYNKTYEHEDHFNYRKDVFRKNLEYLRSHNARADKGIHSHWLEINHLLDRTHGEMQELNGYLQNINGYRQDMQRTEPAFASDYVAMALDHLPTHVNWHDSGAVTPVKNQGVCGSCWSFAVTGALEGQHYKATRKLVALSEQNLIDCGMGGSNDGACCGYRTDLAFEYIIRNKGVDTESSYPYTLKDVFCSHRKSNQQCKFSRNDVGATMKRYVDIPSGSESALLNAVANIGPIAAAIDASQMAFLLYSRGVYNHPECSSTNLDHGVLVVGYGTENGLDYWLVKNSYGPEWGDNGYIKMSRNRGNQCGIATEALYPVID